jgi:hypothetical protein
MLKILGKETGTMYDACIFFAERVNGHKGSALAGTVLVIAKNPRRNGECVGAPGFGSGDHVG